MQFSSFYYLPVLESWYPFLLVLTIHRAWFSKSIYKPILAIFKKLDCLHFGFLSYQNCDAKIQQKNHIETGIWIGFRNIPFRIYCNSEREAKDCIFVFVCLVNHLDKNQKHKSQFWAQFLGKFKFIMICTSYLIPSKDLIIDLSAW